MKLFLLLYFTLLFFYFPSFYFIWALFCIFVGFPFYFQINTFSLFFPTDKKHLFICIFTVITFLPILWLFWLLFYSGITNTLSVIYILFFVNKYMNLFNNIVKSKHARNHFLQRSKTNHEWDWNERNWNNCKKKFVVRNGMRIPFFMLDRFDFHLRIVESGNRYL